MALTSIAGKMGGLIGNGRQMLMSYTSQVILTNGTGPRINWKEIKMAIGKYFFLMENTGVLLYTPVK
jgi:hypothetical protein